jgi:hypothetical protein
MECAIEASWALFWQRELQALSPRHAVCIGLGVYSNLRDRLPAVFSEGVTVVAQPNAWLSGAEHMRNLQQCGEVCAQFARD